MVAPTLRSPVQPLSEQLGELAERLSPSIVSVRDGDRGFGTGLVWSHDTVITNHHVVRDDSAQLVFANGREVIGHIVGRDPHNDLAALRVDGPLEPAVIGDSTALRIGQIVIAIGHPLGIERAMTIGIVSGLPSPSEPRAMIRSDLHLNPGNSGGPLLSGDGAAVGINAMVAGRGTALSVPEYTINAFLARISGQSPALGLELTSVRVPATLQSLTGDGVETVLMVTGVATASAAEQGGVYPGDLLLGIGDRQIRHPLRLREELAMHDPRQPLRLRVIRAGQLLDMVIDRASNI